MVVQRGKGGGGSGSRQERATAQLVRGPGVARGVVVVVVGVGIGAGVALGVCQSPVQVERREHQPWGPAEIRDWDWGGGRSWGGVLTMSMKLSSVAGSFEM
jgi:hypothetical protein